MLASYYNYSPTTFQHSKRSKTSYRHDEKNTAHTPNHNQTNCVRKITNTATKEKSSLLGPTGSFDTQTADATTQKQKNTQYKAANAANTTVVQEQLFS